MGKKRPRYLVSALGLLLAVSAWATLAKLVRQEIRKTKDGDSVVVCIYDASGHEVERVYPMGNFCPQYIDQ